MFEQDDAPDRDDDVLQRYLNEEGLALVPVDFLHDLMKLMEDFILRETGVDSEELGPIIDRLENLIGEDGMLDLSLDGIVDWVKTLKES